MPIISPNHQLPDPKDRNPALADWARAGLECDLALIDDALAKIEAANEAVRDACYRVEMAETRHFVKGIKRLPVNLATTNLLEAARDAGRARLAGRPAPDVAGTSAKEG